MAAGKKRVLDEASGTPKAKKTKTEEQSKKSKDKAEKPTQPVSFLVSDDIDFPRGGGTTLTPLEVKTLRAEAAKEVDKELFAATTEKSVKRKRKSEARGSSNSAAKDGKEKAGIRIEHLNYKTLHLTRLQRVVVGMKILGQVVAVEPLALIVSLPNQLFAHVPITHISTQLTHTLESMEDVEMGNSDDEDEDSSPSGVPDLFEIFRPGQYVRAVVTAVHPPGTTDVSGLGRARDEVQKASRRVELNLVPEKVNEGVVKSDLRTGFTMSAAVKSIEDHGYILDLGMSDVSGFLSFKDAQKGSWGTEKKLHIGQLLDVAVVKMSGNGRTCNVSVDPKTISTASITEVSNVSSIVPGALVQSLVTAVQSDGLVLQVLGYFDGTIDQFHLVPGQPEVHYQVGQKVKARILYDINPSTPPRFALSLADHVVRFTTKSPSADAATTDLRNAYPIGTILEAVKVARVESERGLVVNVGSGIEGFIHISQTSDEHVPTLSASSGAWKLGMVHRARVTGYYPLDGILQLSLRASVLGQKFLQVADVQVGEVIKGTVKKLTDSALFVSISGNVDGVIWPNHYADIALKHPQKRFKPGSSLKCRVLVVDPERKRVALTAKKTLVESTLPTITQFSDAQVGVLTHAVVFKVSDKSLQVELYNNLKATVPAREASETTVPSLSSAFPIGKPVQVRITAVDPETSRITASIRQASPNYKSAIADISGVDIGDIVEGVISDVRKDKAVVALQPTQVTALLSLNNLANRREVSVAQLRSTLKTGDKLQDLVVTSRNPEKGFVLVAMKPKEKEQLVQKNQLSIDTVQPGQLVGGRVLRHARHGALVKITKAISGILHPTDACDDYENGKPFPPVDSVLKAVVISIDKERRQLSLTTRMSRLFPGQDKPIVDREITNISDLKVGETIRGFIKSVAEHGLFVTLGRDIDARVQIRELFDDYVKDWKSRFSANQLVKGRVLSVNIEKKQVELSFRSGDLKRDNQPQLTLSDLSEGQKVDGRVKKVEDYGIFIAIEGSKLSGLCHKSELSDNKDADVTLALRSFREGDKVKAVILSIDQEKRRISFGLKPSYFEERDFEQDESEDEEERESRSSSALGVVEDDDDDDDDDGGVGEDEEEVGAIEAEGDELTAGINGDEDDEADEADDEAGRMDVDLTLDLQKPSGSSSAPSTSGPKESLRLNGGFQWAAPDSSEDVEMGSDQDSDEDVQQEGKKKKKKRKEIEQDLTADMHTRAPESNSDFERLLLGSPNSSYLWVRYIAFQLQISEIDKAREIAKRALKTINFREEQEKLNVWIALLNLENVYGTEESLEATFKDAARHNDSKTIHLRMAEIFEQSDKLEKAEEQYKKTCKKFSQSSKVWSLFGEHYLKRGMLEEARKLLPRSLQSLEKRKHLKTICKFAQLEYKLGDPERGKTIFEGIVDSHPRRWDMWSIYMDMEAGQGDINSLRNLFNRVLTLKMTSHKAKSFFKKWLELERRLGDEEGAHAVKTKAIEWTQRAAGTSGES
ncbi:U3 snoRNP-associated protein Rrp5 [Dichomitus squalens]|uniref:U3 snoRNP-associated protein Rrp5 n=1 Tax=Dichomitus squalens TaxID=114155 RepID=A0A4Q9Q840_9APHY|nr:U3 snoRNP-associated protein Rrp5 [Dichomitus squalens]